MVVVVVLLVKKDNNINNNHKKKKNFSSTSTGNSTSTTSLLLSSSLSKEEEEEEEEQQQQQEKEQRSLSSSPWWSYSSSRSFFSSINIDSTSTNRNRRRSSSCCNSSSGGSTSIIIRVRRSFTTTSTRNYNKTTTTTTTTTTTKTKTTEERSRIPRRKTTCSRSTTTTTTTITPNNNNKSNIFFFFFFFSMVLRRMIMTTMMMIAATATGGIARMGRSSSSSLFSVAAAGKNNMIMMRRMQVADAFTINRSSSIISSSSSETSVVVGRRRRRRRSTTTTTRNTSIFPSSSSLTMMMMSPTITTTTKTKEQISTTMKIPRTTTKLFSSSSASSSSASSSSSSATTTNTTTTTTSTKRGAGGGGGGRVSNAVTDKNLIDKTTSSSSTKKKYEDQQQPSTFVDTNPVKGTRDFYPIDMRLRNWLFNHWHTVARLYNFVEYDSPVLENEALYTRKAGEEVTQQLYNFLDKGNRNVSLRPEMTPSLARMIINKRGSIQLPIKWYSIPQCWRYERMTRGRRREHYQWNMDIWGIVGQQAEIELISAMITFFKNVGLTSDDVGIKINSRLVISEVLLGLGIPESKFAATCVLIDKLDKLPIDAIQDDLQALGLDRSVVETLIDVLTNKSIESLSQCLPENSEAIQQLTKFFTLCKAYDIMDWIQLDASIVRGLAYYTGIVFEAFDRKGQLRAIAGGGRYDKLLESFGGGSNNNVDPMPAVGYGFGDAVIIELLKERNLLPTSIIDKANVDVVVYSMSSGPSYEMAIRVANTLRHASSSASTATAAATTGGSTSGGSSSTTTTPCIELVMETSDTGRKPKWVFKHADRLGSKYCIIIGQDEYENQCLSIKDLSTSKQITIPIDELINWWTTTATTTTASTHRE